MCLFVVTIDHIIYGSRGPNKIDPLCGVFDTIEKAREAIDFLIKTNSELSQDMFEINEVILNETYYG